MQQPRMERHSHLMPSAALSQAQPHLGYPLVDELSLVTIVQPQQKLQQQQQGGDLSPSTVEGVMSLLTPSEAHAFQSFLTSLDAADYAADWNMQLDLPYEHTSSVQGRDALTRATRDLMSLDAGKLRHPLKSSPGGSSATSVHRHPQPQNSVSLLLARAHRSSDSRVHANDELVPSSSSRSYTSSPGPAVGSSPPACQSPSGSNGSVKRSPPLDATSSTKRHRLSNGSLGEEKLAQNNRTALLSPSQKKANHIQSEQKRRANIRRGYDALCEIVPALREACRAEEERVMAHGKSRGRRRNKSTEDGERIDGRAGPKSENVVLSKTIDYVHELLSEKESLLQRLHVARSVLPPNHPLLQRHPDAPPPLWERRWTGGQSNEGEDDDDDEEED
ncbi:hypothetical protein BKA82DRAFT_991924 [Pisolithus tinctorius]|uniref:BHLH domain-containing protein n=1 Tax=Pisolithus tinctorius Marx 270 TaxID=870435 RepID=A0A0C3PZC5_PISTI|nr:hypothetical protein BKA82DRAFT_991924 [Pisolithus tinctorius]KIO15206.1 hypothetical protein M404DRAFT_991924 [Pisolithus tinctorius Marx 270]